MNFEQVFDQGAKDLTEALILFGEGERVNKALVDLERNRPEYYKFYDKGYEAGQQSKQKEIDELNLTIKRLITSEEDIARSCKHWRESFLELDNSMHEVIEIGQKDKQDEIDSLNEALKYILEQLDNPYRTSGEKVEKEVHNILKKK